MSVGLAQELLNQHLRQSQQLCIWVGLEDRVMKLVRKNALTGVAACRRLGRT